MVNLFRDVMNKCHYTSLYSLSLLFATFIFYRCETNWFASEHCINSDFKKLFHAVKQKIPPERTHATSFPTEALPWCCKPGCSVACDTSTMLLRTTGHGTEELKLRQLLPFQGPALLQHSYKRRTLVLFYCLNCQTWNNEAQSRFLLNKVPLAGRKGTWVK